MDISSFIQEVKEKNDIVDVMSSYLTLEKKGSQYWTRCPFHHEKTPSFAINKTSQFYHCFGCGASGDVIKFIMEYESIEFMDALKVLAERVNMTVPQSDEYDAAQTVALKKKKDTLYAIMRETGLFYYNNLKSGKAPRHLEYARQREIPDRVIADFGLGASIDNASLPKHLISKGFSREDVLASGTCYDKDGRLLDSLGGRLIFPIFNSFGEAVAFGGRVMEKVDFAKYKNTCDTLIFNKRKELYNINQVKKLKQKERVDYLIMVEGYMDAIALYKAGFKNVVASMGTSLTKDQARLAKRICDSVLISYDGDFAGQKAAVRGLEIFADEKLNVKVVALTDNLDPDDVIKRFGKDGYQKCLNEAMPLIDFKLYLLEKEYDLSKTDEKRKYTTEYIKVLREVEDESVKDELLKKLGEKIGIFYETLKRDLDKLPKDAEPVLVKFGSTLDVNADATHKAYRIVLAAVLFGADYARGYSLEGIPFANSTHRKTADYIIKQRAKNLPVKPNDLFDLIDGDEFELNALFELGSKGDINDAVHEEEFFDCVKRITQARLKEEMDELNRRLKAETDADKKRALREKIAKKMLEIKGNNGG